MKITMASKPHILLIDDDPTLLRLFGAKLGDAGFEILYAHDGNEGREMARRFSPNLILLDIRIPVEDGYTIAKRLKNEPRTKNIPIVFLSNTDLSIEAEAAMKELYVIDYIHKSVDLNELVKRVKKILQSTKTKKSD